MAGTGAGVKKYVVKLSSQERERLEAVIGSGKRSAQLITKARILLKADASDAGEGWTDREIAAALETSLNTVGNVRRQPRKDSKRRWCANTIRTPPVRGFSTARRRPS